MVARRFRCGHLNRLGGGRSVATNDPVQLRQARNQVARLQRRQESATPWAIAHRV